MVVCRCGCEFENFRMDSHVVCPKCGRIYPNEGPDMYHPKTEDERKWECVNCGNINSNSYAGCPRVNCEKCSAARPGHGIVIDEQKSIKKNKKISDFLINFFKKPH